MSERPNWRAALWLRRHRIRGQQGFIWSIVVLRLALPAAAIITLVRAWINPTFARDLGLHALGSAVAAVLGGYVAGRILWDLVVNRGGRTPTSVTEPPATRDPTRTEHSDRTADRDGGS